MNASYWSQKKVHSFGEDEDHRVGSTASRESRMMMKSVTGLIMMTTTMMMTITMMTIMMMKFPETFCAIKKKKENYVTETIFDFFPEFINEKKYSFAPDF